jgi:hypothetical protein
MELGVSLGTTGEPADIAVKALGAQFEPFPD